ncbi:biotin--[acetyl-CoA-carboxylase] ligase [Candidatus Epulonipiscium fishelsonii]|uniref:Biotin--[acetyl-CoA-carboxylase] ligase n=1 Tax=Candidatus Epulonipiscium fishelsonii TaxID=77094 RepID=A0ACC8XDF0_9FIRM|nr:biotin--[acetyl-CoA-carboxylase] ligase [Epulopiscium sp. SCG-B11WGA-EpuloA1]ONI42177.1 biotin--[acetyl-CoA-carboxylase] ligase [Epulopiscium sp. SCG-B05WGA-EpuloA1]
MTTKEQVLKLLLKNPTKHISGEQIANELNMSRNAIWKVIKSLETEGYDITAVRNKGYSLNLSTDILSKSGIENYIDNKTFFDIETYDSVPSTNTLAKKHASQQPMEGKVIVSKMQTQGRGRRGRDFYSPNDTGVYFSIVLCPKLEKEELTFITSLTAVAVCRAIQKLSDTNPKIKWVNDIYIDNKKVSGILTEASFSIENGQVEYVIVGIGINIYKPEVDFPEDIKNIAGYIFEETSIDIRNKLVATVLNEFLSLYQNFNIEEIAKEYKNLSFIIGKTIYVLTENDKITAKVNDINSRNELVVEYEDGKIEALNSGEISIKVQNTNN